MTKTKITLNLKKQKIKKEMELRKHNNMKTIRRKKSQTVVKDIEPKDKAKGSIEGGIKKLLRSPHLIHLSLIRILRCSIVKKLLE